MKFDTFLATVNDWGKFQKVKYTLICLTYMLPSMMVYTYTFTAAKPETRCAIPKAEMNDSFSPTLNEIYKNQYRPSKERCDVFAKGLSTKECQRCYYQPLNKSEDLLKCNKYVFDKKDFKDTLVEEWTMVCDRVDYRSTIQIIFFIGYMVGSVVFGMLADRFGRRPIMSVSFILMAVAGFICAFGPQDSLGFWPSYLIYMLGRFLLACATRGISVSGFVLGSEIVGPSKRLLAGIVIEYFFAFGQLFLVFFAYFIRTWRTLSWAISLFTVPFISFYFILPESPRWLVSKGRYEEAEQVLRYIAKKNERHFDENAFQQLKEEQEKNMLNKTNQEGILSLFRTKLMFLISINLFFQWLIQNLVFYGVSQGTGSWPLGPHLSFTVSALVEIAGYALVHVSLDRFGRKLPYCSFAILFGITAILILPIQKFTEDNITLRNTLMNIINGLLKLFASASYATIYIFANELFPTNVRNTGMGTCSMIARIGAMIGTYCNDALVRIYEHFPFLVYGGASLFAAFIALTLPETLNKPLPETIDDVKRIAMKKVPIEISSLSKGNGSHSGDALLTLNDQDNALKENSKRNDLQTDQS